MKNDSLTLILLVEKQGFPILFIANITSNVFFTSYVA